MHTNSTGCPKIFSLPAPVLYWLSHLTRISSLKAKNERKMFIFTQLKTIYCSLTCAEARERTEINIRTLFISLRGCVPSIKLAAIASDFSSCEFSSTWWGCCATDLDYTFLFCSCVYFCLYGPFKCISFHKFFPQLSGFLLCSSGFISTLLVLATIISS